MRATILLVLCAHEYHRLVRRFCEGCIADWWLLPQEQFPWQPSDVAGPYLLEQVIAMAKSSPSVIVLADSKEPGALKTAQVLESLPDLKTRSVTFPWSRT